MEKKPHDLGKNRTGISLAPAQAKEMEAGAAMGLPTSPDDDGEGAKRMRLAYAREAEPVGTMPPPTNLKGLASTALDMLKGGKATVFLDKLGERLAFERSGSRLYEALITKYDAAPPEDREGVDREALRHIQAEEVEHFRLLWQAFEELGADPTVMTPCADLVGVEGQGLMQVLNDPRTSLAQGLHAILVAELTDLDGWRLLIDLAESLGHAELAGRFREAESNEEEHLVTIRETLQGLVQMEAGKAR